MSGGQRRVRRRLGGGGPLGAVRLARPGRDAHDAEPLLGGLDQLVEHLADLRLRRRALEQRQRLAGDDREDGRNALHPELLEQHLVAVHVDLRQDDPARVLLGEAFQDRAQLLAGLAPLGPEIDDHRHFGAALEHLLLEGRLIDIDHQPGGRRALALRLGRPLGPGLLGLLLRLGGGLHRGEIDGSAHGHIAWLHGTSLPLRGVRRYAGGHPRALPGARRPGSRSGSVRADGTGAAPGAGVV